MSRHDDIHIRVVDKRVSYAGIEYQLYPTDDWLRSAILRKSSPHLVELYSWISSLGGDPRRGLDDLDGPNNSLSSLSPWSKRSSKLSAASSIPPHRGGSGAKANGNSSGTTTKVIPRPVPANRRRTTTLEAGTTEVLAEGINNDLAEDQVEPPERASSVKGDFSAPLCEHDQPQQQQQQEQSAPPQQQQSTSSPESKAKDLKVLDFDQNAIQHIATFFKEGLDATGITVFGDLLGPNRRPTVELISSFFYGVVLSPLLEPALIEAALQILQRTLQLHGPEPFAGLWDVSARRRELRDGTLPIISGFFNPKSAAVSNLLLSYPLHSGANSPATSSSSAAASSIGGGYGLDDDDGFGGVGGGEGSGWSKGIGSTGDGGGVGVGAGGAIGGGVGVIPRRLPAWNDIWEMMRAQLRLDNRQENRRFFEFQEFRINLVLQQPNGLGGGESSSSEEEDEEEEEKEEGENADETNQEGSEENGSSLSPTSTAVNGMKRKRRHRQQQQPSMAAKAPKQRPEREIRDELGRKLVGFLFDVLEQDIVQKNARLALDFIFQVVQTATIEPYLKRPVRVKQQQSLSYTSASTAVANDNHPHGVDTVADESSNAMDISFTEDDSMTGGAHMMDIVSDHDHEHPDKNPTHNNNNNNQSNGHLHLADVDPHPAQCWDRMGRSELTAAGQELLDLAHRMLAWLIQYAQSGMFGRELDSDWVAREVLQRIGKLQNLRDSEERRNVGGSWGGGGGGRGRSAANADGATAAAAASPLQPPTAADSSESSMEDRIAKCRMRIDQTEAFWRGLVYPNACSLSTITRPKRVAMSGDGDGESSGDDHPLEPLPGLCTFTMIILDLQFRIHGTGASLSKARVPGSLPVFKHVVEYYAAPPPLPECFTSFGVTAAASIAMDEKQQAVRAAPSRRKQAGRPSKKAVAAAAAQALMVKKANDKVIDEILMTLDNLEWHVMKMEILIAAWIRSSGLRREDLAGTGLEAHPLLVDVDDSVKATTTVSTSPATAANGSATSPRTGWMAMSQTLQTVGGSLWTRWQNLEQSVALAVLTEELGMA
ncbi:hypothetical protein DFQ26_008710 [Actinomortierella ambigua]|nr:hypothetical protein DFQ26_008710 [Actinomortierella ambigua]